jgi:penicillin V acylase-like amidase (Ntn superfamily)
MSQIGRLILVLLGVALVTASAQPCTRYLWNNNKLGVFASRTMDWPGTTEPILWVFPRGMARDGSLVGGVQAFQDNPAKWTSKYGSLVTSVYGVGTADGINEKGLTGHMLYLSLTEFGERDPKKMGVQAGLWLQYLLDNAANVKEAVKCMDMIQPVMITANGHKATVHLAIEDPSGDSAVIEFVKGEQKIYHGKQYRIMTNDPTYDEQLKLLETRLKDFSTPSSQTELPGNVMATHRFQRAAYYGALLPEPKNEREAISSVMAIARNVSVPFGAPYAKFGVYDTEYRTAVNVTGMRYYFELTRSPNVFWVDVAKCDFTPGSKVLTLNPDDIELAGEVSAKFKKIDKSPF